MQRNPRHRLLRACLLPALLVTAAAHSWPAPPAVAQVPATEELITPHWIGPETPVNEPRGLAFWPSLATASDGQVLVAWAETSQANPSGFRLQARLRHVDGSWGVLMTLSDGPLWQGPQVSAASNGSFLVSWLDAIGPRARVVDRNGRARPIVTLGDRPRDGLTLDWQLLPMPGGRLLAAWRRLVAGGPGSLFEARAYGRFGRPSGVAQLVGHAVQPSGLQLASNGVLALAAWNWQTCDSDCHAYGSTAVRLRPDASVVDPDHPIALGSRAAGQVAVAAQTGGGFVLTWIDSPVPLPTPGDDPRTWIAARRLDAAGEPVGPDIEVVSPAPEQYIGYPRAAIDPTGGLLVSWYRDAGPTYRAQAFDPDAAHLGGPFVPATAAQIWDIATTALAANDYLVATLEPAAGPRNGEDVRVNVQRVHLAASAVALSADLLETDESGTPAQVTVALVRQPAAPVTLHLAIEPAGVATVEPSQLVFDASSWNRPQAVTVAGLDDGVVAGDVAAAVITQPLLSADPTFSGYDPPDIRIRRRGEDPCTVHAPGVDFFAGAQQRIVYWSTSGDGCGGEARLELIREGATIADLGTTTLTAGYLLVEPPRDLPLAGNYRLRLTSLERPALVAESGDFWGGPAITCQLGIGTPRYGETWLRGTTRQLRWWATPGCAGHRVRIEVNIQSLAEAGVADHSFTWTIPADFPLGLTTVRLVVPEDPRITSPLRYFVVAP